MRANFELWMWIVLCAVLALQTWRAWAWEREAHHLRDALLQAVSSHCQTIRRHGNSDPAPDTERGGICDGRD